AHSPIRSRLAQPRANRVEAGRGDRIGLRVARARAGLLDQSLVEEARQLRIDLTVARRPRVHERLLEVLEQCVPGPGLVGERAEEGVSECHLMSILTCRYR